VTVRTVVATSIPMARRSLRVVTTKQTRIRRPPGFLMLVDLAGAATVEG
jgi:hypothetical protein